MDLATVVDDLNEGRAQEGDAPKEEAPVRHATEIQALLIQKGVAVRAQDKVLWTASQADPTTKSRQTQHQKRALPELLTGSAL